MRIVCPSCAATYDVSDDKLAVGRLVRCGRCQAEWSPALSPEAVAKPIPETLPEPKIVDDGLLQGVEADEALDEALEVPPPAPSRRGLIIAWVVSLAVLLLIGWGAYAWRGDVMRIWPPSARLYTALGMPTGPR